MKRFSARVSLVACFAAATCLQLSASAATSRGEWRPLEVSVSPSRGTASFISGQFRFPGEQGAVAVARAFLRSGRSLTGVTSPDTELEVSRVVGPDALGMTHVFFAQRAAGVPVFGSDLVVHVRGDVVTSMNGAYLPSLRVSPRVELAGDEAASIALDHVQLLVDQDELDGLVGDRIAGLELDGNPRLVFFNPGLVEGTRTGTLLAWQVSVSGVLTFVDAGTGAVLDSWDNMPRAINREVYTAKNTTSTPGTLVCSESKGCSSTDADTKGAWDQLGATYNYFSGTHKRDSYDGKGGKLVGTVHYSQNFQNAYWSGTQMVFGDGFVVLDVTAHELSHGVTQATCNLTYKNQSGALNESFSDVWGVMVDRDDWLMGEDLSIGAVRDMSNPGAYGQPKDMTEYKNYRFYDNGGVHINSGIPNYAAYLLSDGGTNQGVKVTAQGREVTEKIWYRTLTTKLTSSATFADFAKASITACEEIYKKDSVQCKETTNAMKATKMI